MGGTEAEQKGRGKGVEIGRSVMGSGQGCGRQHRRGGAKVGRKGQGRWGGGGADSGGGTGLKRRSPGLEREGTKD